VAKCSLTDERRKVSRKSDPRPARTRELLFNTLIALIQEKRWERIRVQDILDRSGVGRSTFYAHFDNKFDLLTAEMPKFEVPVSSNGEPDVFPLFSHVDEVAPIMKPLLTQPMLSELLEQFHRRMAESWDEHLASLGITQEQRLVASEILAGAFIAVSRRWVTSGLTPGPKEMAVNFNRYAAAITEQAVSAP